MMATLENPGQKVPQSCELLPSSMIPQSGCPGRKDGFPQISSVFSEEIEDAKS